MRLAPLPCLLVLAACAASPALPPGERIGQEMVPRDIVPFATIDADPQPWFERTLLVEATVTQVCQKMGCWMQIEDQGRTAFVRWETGCGGAYAFPKDAAGRRVVIQGSVYPKTISEADAAHLEEESGGALDVRREGYELNASAVLLVAE